MLNTPRTLYVPTTCKSSYLIVLRRYPFQIDFCFVLVRKRNRELKLSSLDNRSQPLICSEDEGQREKLGSVWIRLIKGFQVH